MDWNYLLHAHPQDELCLQEKWMDRQKDKWEG